MKANLLLIENYELAVIACLIEYCRYDDVLIRKQHSQDLLRNRNSIRLTDNNKTLSKTRSQKRKKIN
jgi:hypothetical protein